MQNTSASKESASSICIYAHIKEKVIPVACGPGSQRIKWLGHVAIARYDDKNYQGWLDLGVPASIELQDGTPLELGQVIKDVLRDEMHVVVTPSLSLSDFY
ncbi:unnamed protein product [Phaeothamnion confervicola]